jgi:cysteine synthase A
MTRGLGAEVVPVAQVDGSNGRVTGSDLVAVEDQGIEMASRRGAFYVDQYHNPGTIAAHEEGRGPEIYRQCAGRINAFAASVGTDGTLVGVARALKRENAQILGGVAEPCGQKS